MQRSTRIKLLTTLTLVLTGLLVSSTAIGQTTDSAETSRTTPAAVVRCLTLADCETQLGTALERLDKTLDAYEKATAVIAAKDIHIEALKLRDELRMQHLAIKDQMIAAQGELIKFYEKKLYGTKSRLKKLLERAGRLVMLAAGIYLGAKL